MTIRVVKKGNRNQLVCTRNDGSTDFTDLGPNLPFHDIAHYVAESHLNLQQGFYGNIAQGHSVQQLSDKHVIRTLPQEAMTAEIITRALQSLYGGSLTMEQFPELVAQEFTQWSIRFRVPDAKTLTAMLRHYAELIVQWETLPEGGFLELNWNQ